MANTRKFDEQEALEAMRELFWRKGYEATSLSDLVETSGVPRQSLYNTFGNKEAIFEAAFESYANSVNGNAFARLDVDNPRDGITGFLDQIVENNINPQTPQGCLRAGSESELGARDDALGEMIRKSSRNDAAALTAIFHRWSAEGKLADTADPDQLAAFLMSVSRGLAGLARAGQDPATIKLAAEGAKASFAQWMA